LRESLTNGTQSLKQVVNMHSNYQVRKKKPRRQRTGALCVQQSPTAAALSTFFLLNMRPNSPELNTLITRFRSHTAEWVWVVSQKDWKNSAATVCIMAMQSEQELIRRWDSERELIYDDVIRAEA